MRLALLLLSSLCLTSAACSSGPRAPAPDPRSAVTTLRVENNSFLDMNIYVLRGSERVRLGTVTGNSTRVLEIPRHIVSTAIGIRFLADPIGSNRTPVSEEITVIPGDEVTMRIPPS